MNWHIESVKETAQRLRTDEHVGLSGEEAERRLRSLGGNIIAEQPHKTFRQRVGSQLRSFLVVILLSAALISLVVAVNSPGSDIMEPLTVMALTVVCAAACAAVEQSAEDQRVKLLSMSEAECRVIRDGKVRIIEAATLVPGDVLLLRKGDIAPADGRLISCSDMRCDERSVGGDEYSQPKDAASEPDITAAISGRTNLIYAGCPVLSGTGKAIVTETGSGTEAGKHSTLLEYVDERNTPMKRQIAAMNKNLALAGLLVMFAVFVIGFMSRHLNGVKAIDMFVVSVTMAVAAIPECAPLVAEAIRMKCAAQMSERGELIKNADVLETLGCVSVICADKGSMVEKRSVTLRRLWTPDGRLFTVGRRTPADSELRLLEYAAMCSSAGTKRGTKSSPADIAIISCLRGFGIKKRGLEANYPKVASYPFDPKKRYMLTVHRAGESYVAIVKGSPEKILAMCGEYSGEKADYAERVRGVCDAMGEDSLQVIAVACMGLDKLPKDSSWADGETGFAMLGLLGMENHPAKEAKLTAKQCKQAGIRVVMLTGDQASTARTIAAETGILRQGEGLLDSAGLALMDEKELDDNMRKYSVFADLNTEDKLRVIEAWQQSSETVAATGSSEDDIMILRQADIGCAMGARDADTVRGIADITISSDSLSSVYNAVRDGRRAFRNIRCAVQYILTASLAIAAVFLTGTLLTGAAPLAPAQMLLLFPVSILFPAAAFASEPAGGELMSLPPRHPDSRFFSPRFILDTIVYGLLITIVTLTAFFTGRVTDMESARTMAYAVLALSLLAQSLTVRTKASFYTREFYENADFLLTFFICVSITLLLLFLPWKGFSLYDLTFGQWTVVGTLSAAPLVCSELLKILRRTLGGHIITGIEDV